MNLPPAIGRAASVLRNAWQRVRPFFGPLGPLMLAIGFAAIGGALCTWGTPLWWVGVSLWVAAGLTVYHGYRERFRVAAEWLAAPRHWLGRNVVVGTLLLDLFYVGLLLWVASVMMHDVIEGGRPVSHDHTVHYFKAWQLHKDFLPHGRLYGWSHRWFAGYPVDYLYPIGTDLFVNLVYGLSFGTLDFSQAYGTAFVIFHMLTGYSTYRLGRVVGGPHVGLIAGMLMLTDMSAFRLGGWAYTIEYGVWPQALSLTFALLAVARLPAIYETRELRHIGIFALYMGAAIVTHPIELIYLALLLVVAVLAGLFVPQVKTAAGTFRLLCAYALSVLVSAGWLFPFMATHNKTTPMGVWWDSTYEMGKGVLNLTAFQGTLGYVLVLGMLGAVIMLRSRNFVLMFTALMALFIPAVSSSTFIDELHLTSVLKSLSNIQWLRMATMAKPFWFTMAGYCVVSLVRKSRVLLHGSASGAPRAMSSVREVVLGTLISFLALPILVPACQAFWTGNVLKTLTTEADRDLDPDRGALVQWLKTKLPHDGFYRVCLNTGHNHDLMDVATELSVPLYKRGFTPAENFIYKMNIEDIAVLKAVNVRFMVAKKWMPPDHYEELAHFGIYRVFRFKDWTPDPFVVTQGQGEVKLERFGNDEIVLRAKPGATGKLRLNVSYFPRWHAYLNGKRVPIWTTALSEAPTNTGFMTVALAPGIYRFVFEPNALDKTSLPLTLVGLLFALTLLFSDGRKLGRSPLGRAVDAVSGWLEVLSSQRFARARVVLLVLLLAGGFVTLIFLAERRIPLVLENLEDAVVKRVRYDFLEELADASVNIEYRQQNRPCRRFGERFVCRNADGMFDNEKYVASTPAEIEEYKMVRCIRARPEEDALLSIYYPGVPAGDAVVGYFGVERAGRLMRLTRPVDFKVLINGRAAYDSSTVSDNKMHWFRADVGEKRRDVNVMFTVSAHNISKRYFCFYAQMVDLGKAKKPQGKGGRAKAGEEEDDPTQ